MYHIKHKYETRLNPSKKQTNKQRDRNTTDIKIAQMMVGKQWVKSQLKACTYEQVKQEHRWRKRAAIRAI